MRKTFLMMLLCAPLLWTAWREGQRIREVAMWPDARAGVAEPGARSPDLSEIKARADALINLPDSVTRTIVRLDPPSTRDRGTGSFDRAILAHAKARQKGREKVEEARRQAAELEAKIVGMLADLRGEGSRPGGRQKEIKELEARLGDYGRLEVFDPDLLASTRAEAAWPALDRDHPGSALDDFYERLDRWSPVASAGDSSGEAVAVDHRDAYDAYIDAHRTAKGAVAADLVRQATERLELWRRGAELAGVLEKPEAHRARTAPPPRIPGLSPSQATRLEQVAAIVELAHDDPPDRFVTTARRVLQALCADLLEPEPLDDKVLVITDPQAEPDLCSRNAVFIRFKDQTRRPLDKCPFDEYTIPRESIENLELPGSTVVELQPNVTPLKGTEYSDAIRDFNRERARVRQWSEPELLKLRRACEPNEARLSRGPETSTGRTLIQRIDALLTQVRRRPNLFVATTP